MFIYKGRRDVRKHFDGNARAAQAYAFIIERYNCLKYENSSYYKGALLWDKLSTPVVAVSSLLEFISKIASLLYIIFIMLRFFINILYKHWKTRRLPRGVTYRKKRNKLLQM